MNRIHYGVGAHEPIWHRLRTGNATAEEWDRWQRETSTENLDLLSRLGVSHAHIACTKGFGLEYEKPLIERAARFAEAAAKRGIRTSVYVQGFPVYYETFLLERPEAAEWLARNQQGDFVPWGGQTFRRWMDPTRREFHDYQRRLLEYVLKQFTPSTIYMDNTLVPAYWTDSGRESFRRYLRERYAGDEPARQFGIPSFEAVDLPRFDAIYYPRDAYRVVKDPLLQEWARWRSAVMKDFLAQMVATIRPLAPDTPFAAAAGCDVLRYNHLFNAGVDFEDLLTTVDSVGTEESWWRPGVAESTPADRQIVMDERSPGQEAARTGVQVRVSTDSRWWKICSNYGKSGHHGFWGETSRQSKLVALAHNLAFGANADDLGIIGPLAAHPKMLDDIADVIEWCNGHADVLTGRGERIAPAAVWRGTSTLGFIRHRPVWEACAVEQMLYENHLPFTILLDGGLERFCRGTGFQPVQASGGTGFQPVRASGGAGFQPVQASGGTGFQPVRPRLLILPGTACVSDRQVETITKFVHSGGALLLLGEAGTRDERTRLRRKYAFEHLFGGALPNVEVFGPPHWVPELDWSAMPEKLSARCGEGSATMIKQIVPRTPLDLTRDPYMPERQVMAKDILPPANEEQIMGEVDGLLGDCLRVTAPRWTLCEFWRRGNDLLVCCANLHSGRDGGPLTVHLGPCRAASAQVHTLLEKEVKTIPVRDGNVTLGALRHFAGIELKGALG